MHMSACELLVSVSRKVAEATDINSYELVSLDGQHLPAFDAGAHIDVHLPNGLTRQYSLCSKLRHGGHYRIAVLRDPKTRGGSQAVHEQVNEGDTLRISRPRNLFPLHDGEHKSVLLAGGIGITPLLAMAYQLSELGKPLELHYFVRSRNRAAFLDELKKSPFAAQVAFHFDDEVESNINPLSAILKKAPQDANIYTCGPAGFLNHVLETASAQGWPSGQVHYESFTPVQLVEGESFEVQIRSLGQSVVVAPDETVVAAVARLGIEIPVSCEQGVCGTCLTKVVKGIPDHKDQYLTGEEHARNDQLTPCCSRSLSPVLVLDL